MAAGIYQQLIPDQLLPCNLLIPLSNHPLLEQLQWRLPNRCDLLSVVYLIILDGTIPSLRLPLR